MTSLTLNISSSKEKIRQNNPNLNPSNFQVNYTPPKDLKGITYEIALLKLNMWRTNHNVVGKSLNWSSDDGSSWNEINFPDGLYSVPQVNEVLRKELYDGGFYITDANGVASYGITISPNFSTNRVDIVIDNSANGTFQIDLSDAGDPNNLREYFGFPDAVVTATSTGTTIAAVDGGIDRWLLHCDLVTNSYDNGITSDILFAFKPKGETSENFEIEPQHLQWLQINRRYLDQIRFRLTDQLDREIDLQGEDIEITIQLRPI